MNKRIVELSPEINNKYRDEGRRTSKKNFPDGIDNITLRGSNKFKVETQYIIIEKFCTEKRIDAYNFVSEMFLFLTKLWSPITNN